MVLTAPGAPLEARQFDIPVLAEGGILVRMTASGICGSDVHMRHGKDPRTRYPIILGHEGLGIVEDIRGDRRYLDGTPIRTGDTVIWNRSVSCGHCRYCSDLRTPSLCRARWVYGIHTSCADEPYLNGCYAQHIILSPDTDLFRVDSRFDGVRKEVLVSASCSGATIAHAFELVPPGFGDTVLVQGPGPLGLYAVAFAKAMGASRVIVIGGSPQRLEACGEMGADTLINRREIPPERRYEMIMDLTDGIGVDMAIDCAGDTGAVKEGIACVRAGGAYVSPGFGVPAGTMELDCYHELVRKNLRLQGVWVSDTKHTAMSLSLVAGLGSACNGLVSHTVPLSKADEALDLAASGSAVKVVLVPDGITGNGIF